MKLLHEPMSRRAVLRGLGTALALPLLDAMVPVSALAQAAAKSGAAAAGGGASPLRLAFLFVPNGMHMPAWTPASEGALTTLPPLLQPLKNVKDSISVLTGLAQNNARALGDGGGDHARSAAAWLTGCHPRKTSGANIKAGISADQLAARKVGKLTRFASLEIGCERGQQAGSCDSGYSCAYSSSIAWRGEANPVAKEVDPRLVFDRLFGAGDAGEAAQSRTLRERYEKSILDFVLEDANRLKVKLGAHDQNKLDEYFTGVREIEQRLQFTEKVSGAAERVGAKRPTGVPRDYAEHVRLMGDMMILAFQADLTRVSTFMFANEGSGRSYPMVGVTEGHHELSHHGKVAEKQEKVQKINEFHLHQLAYMLEKMKGIKDGNGTLLDNTMLIYGGGISDGDRHNHNDLPILLAGKGGGTIKTGQHIVYPKDTPMSNLFLSLLDRMGVPAESIGDSTGRLQQLF